MNKQLETKINNFFIREMNSGIGDVSIFNYEDGIYELFNRYKITKQDNNLFEVSSLYGDMKYLFSSLKNAVIWCIYEKRKKWQISKRIEELDAKISGIDVSSSIIKKLIMKEKDPDIKFTYIIKLNEEKLRKKCMLEELAGYAIDAKVHQHKSLYLKDHK